MGGMKSMSNDSEIIKELNNKNPEAIENVMEKYGTIICGLIGNIYVKVN